MLYLSNGTRPSKTNAVSKSTLRIKDRIHNCERGNEPFRNSLRSHRELKQEYVHLLKNVTSAIPQVYCFKVRPAKLLIRIPIMRNFSEIDSFRLTRKIKNINSF